MKWYLSAILLILSLTEIGEDMLIDPYRFSGYLVFLTRGDSISAGAGATTGPTANVGAVYEWDQVNSVLIDRATTDFSTAASGSPWKKMGIDLNAATGKKIVFITCGLSGAEVYPNGTGTNTHWAPNYDTSGASVPGGTGSTLYNNTVTQVAACLAFLGKSALDGICDIVGINDARGPASLANISAGFTSLYDKTNADFPGVPIFATAIGRDEDNTIGDRTATVRRYQRVLSDNRSYYHLVANLMSFINESWDYYQGDNLHPSQTGNNVLGAMYARYYGYSESNKQVKQVWNCFESLSTAHKAAWKTWVEAQQASGNWAKLEYFAPGVGTNIHDVMVDVRMLGNPLDSNFSFTANTSIRVFSTSNYRRMGILPASSWISATSTNFIIGTKILANSTAAGTNAYLFGVTHNPGSGIRQLNIAQLNTNSLQWYAGDNTSSTDATFTKLQDNTLYSVYRSGTTKGLIGNSTTIGTATVTLVGLPTEVIYEGVRNSSGVAGTPIDATIEYSYQAQYSGFDLANFVSTTATLITALKTP